MLDECFPRDELAHLEARIRLYEDMSMAQRALDVLRTAAALHPQHAHVAFLLGQTLWKLDRYASASRLFVRAHNMGQVQSTVLERMMAPLWQNDELDALNHVCVSLLRANATDRR